MIENLSVPERIERVELRTVSAALQVPDFVDEPGIEHRIDPFFDSPVQQRPVHLQSEPSLHAPVSPCWRWLLVKHRERRSRQFENFKCAHDTFGIVGVQAFGRSRVDAAQPGVDSGRIFVCVRHQTPPDGSRGARQRRKAVEDRLQIKALIPPRVQGPDFRSRIDSIASQASLA